MGAFFLNQKFCYGYLLRKMGKFTNLINELTKCTSYATDCRSIHLGIDSKDPFPYAQVQQAQVLTLNCRVRSCVVNAFFVVGNNNLNVKKKHVLSFQAEGGRSMGVSSPGRVDIFPKNERRGRFSLQSHQANQRMKQIRSRPMFSVFRFSELF